ncbi:MerR family DNA-binding transcriptional regulator [Streptosporangium canum]|uniref:MerR family DNA-binding transcriptional regulator n=1 Tax=Streptosporangium canum TaxID=324952 RepID=UPI000B81F168
MLESADRADMSVRALRYYEEQNLLASVRSPSGQRQYPDSAVDRVQLLQRRPPDADGPSPFKSTQQNDPPCALTYCCSHGERHSRWRG